VAIHKLAAGMRLLDCFGAKAPRNDGKRSGLTAIDSIPPDADLFAATQALARFCSDFKRIQVTFRLAQLAVRCGY
jgi:hypothetical protein